MSDDLKNSLDHVGLDKAELKEIAGSDGKIDRKDEFKKLFKVVDGFDKDPKSNNSFEYYEKSGTSKSPTLSKSGILYEVMESEVERNRMIAGYQYAKPGAKIKKDLPMLTETDAVTVPKGDQKSTVKFDAQHVFQYDLYPNDKSKGDKACVEAAKKQCDLYNQKTHGADAPKLNGWDKAIQVGYAEDSNGRLVVNPEKAKAAREYIDKALDKGYPVFAGVSTQQDNINYDKLFEHAISITGRGYDPDGRLYYNFLEPGTSGANKEGKLYVDNFSGKLYKVGNPNAQYVSESPFEVTHVRTYDKLP
jgi:hypothetical protein